MTSQLDLAIYDMTANPWQAAATKRRVNPVTLYNDQRRFWIDELARSEPDSVGVFIDRYPRRVPNPDGATGQVTKEAVKAFHKRPTHTAAGLQVDVSDHVRAIQAEADMVNHPPHYTNDPSGVECIQITRHRNFNIGNAIKYLWRAGLKDDPRQSARAKHIEDLSKAIWYIEDEIKRLKSLTTTKES